MAEPICVVPAGDWTGEGAVWHAGEGAVYWVDIGRYIIHRFDPKTGNVRNWLFPEGPTAIGLTTRDDTLIVALASKVILWQPGNDARADFANPEHGRADIRLNDGRPDPAGNFWVGSMRTKETPETAKDPGRLYRISGDGSIIMQKAGIQISNTFCWSPDARRFYFGDTVVNQIWSWDYEAARGTIANQRPFFAGFHRGSPDGSSIDRDGYLWNCRWGGSCIVRVAPDGKVDRIIEMPVTNVTTCTFGGPQLKTLYITTARKENERLGGSLFSLAVDVPGIPENRFRLPT